MNTVLQHEDADLKLQLMRRQRDLGLIKDRRLLREIIRYGAHAVYSYEPCAVCQCTGNQSKLWARQCRRNSIGYCARCGGSGWFSQSLVGWTFDPPA